MNKLELVDSDGESLFPITDVECVNGIEDLIDTKMITPEDMINFIFNKIYPVGCIYMSINNKNPSLLFGGEWLAWGQGRVPVGVDTSGTFNTIEKIGGAENVGHTHTSAAHTHTSAAHTHTGPSHSHGLGAGYAFAGRGGTNAASPTAITINEKTVAQWASTAQFGAVGTTQMYSTRGIGLGGTTDNGGTGATGSTTPGATGSTSSSTVQPYITCYMWKRVA